MNKKKINLFILILVLTSIAGTLIFWKLLFFKKSKPLPETPKPTPTSTPTPILIPTSYPLPSEPEKGDPLEKIREESLKEFPLFDYTPYITEQFVVDYTAPLHLKVFLEKDTPQVRQEVLDWIRSKGVDPKTHKIEWIKKD